MKEPKRIKLTDSPESKKVKLTPLPSLDIDSEIYKTQLNNENHNENNTQSIQQLESYETD